MTRIGTRAEVWISNVVASFARYVAERTLSESVPMLMRHDAVIDSFNYAKEKMKAAYSFLDRFEGLSLSITEARRRFPSRKLVLEFGVFKGGMINYQARKFPELNFVGFDSFEGLQEQWSGMAPEKTFDLGGKLPRVRRNVSLVKGWFAVSGTRWKAENPGAGVPLLVHVCWYMSIAIPTPQRSTCLNSVPTTSNMASSFISTTTSGFPIGELAASRRCRKYRKNADGA